MRNLSNLRPTPGSRRKRKRVGRGDGSGHGTYSGRGIKGQKARSGHSRRAGFEGGQTPLWRRIPKRGFVNVHRREYAYVNLDELMVKFDDGDEVTPEVVLEIGMVDKLQAGLKVLGRGDCDKALTVRAHKVSKSAREKLEAAGGRVILLEPEDEPELESSSETATEASIDKAESEADVDANAAADTSDATDDDEEAHASTDASEDVDQDVDESVDDTADDDADVADDDENDDEERED